MVVLWHPINSLFIRESCKPICAAYLILQSYMLNSMEYNQDVILRDGILLLTDI